MTVNVDIDLKNIPVRLDNMTEQGQYALANQVHSDMNNYVPMLTGDLRNQSNVALDNKSIIYNAPYARRRFYEPAINYTTPGTGARWDLKAKSIHGSLWVKITKAAMK